MHRRGRLAWALLAVAGLSTAHAQTVMDPIESNLVRPDASWFVSYQWTQRPKLTMLYFGAEWCGPCHALMPRLHAVYRSLQEAGVDTEVIYVSLDTSEREMHRYMQRARMPWPAVDYRRLANMGTVRSLGGPAPPTLVLIDQRGKVLASAWSGRRYTGTTSVMQSWVAHAQHFVAEPTPRPEISR